MFLFVCRLYFISIFRVDLGMMSQLVRVTERLKTPFISVTIALTLSNGKLTTDLASSSLIFFDFLCFFVLGSRYVVISTQMRTRRSSIK